MISISLPLPANDLPAGKAKPKDRPLRKSNGRKWSRNGNGKAGKSVRLSELLTQVLERDAKEPLTVRELVDGLGTSTFGIPLSLFSLPEVLPIPLPGMTTVVVVPTAIIGAQMVAGRETLALPESLLRRKVPLGMLQKGAAALLPTVQKIERYSRSNSSWINTKAARRLIGVLILLLAFTIALPIPGTNIPPAIAILLLSLALVEKDQRLLWAGVLLGLVSMLVILGGTAFLLLSLL